MSSVPRATTTTDVTQLSRWHSLAGSVLMSLFAILHLHVADSMSGASTMPQHDRSLFDVLLVWSAGYVAATVALLWRGRGVTGYALLRAEQVAMTGGVLLMAYAMG